MNRLKPSFFNPLKPPLPPQPTTTKSFNSIINRLSAEGAHHDVLFTYSSMLKSSTPSDAYTFPSLLKACTSLELLSLGLLFHQRIIVYGYSSEAYIASSLINFYAKFGCIDDARQVFDMVPERDIVPWTAIIGCYSRAGDVDTAFSMHDQMRHQGVQPNSVTLLGLLSGVSEFTHVQCIHACVIQYGFNSDLALVNSLMHVYGNCGRVEDARDMFESMDQRDIFSWTSLVSGYAQIGSIREILQLLNRMRSEGTEPDQRTFGYLVSATAAKSKLELGKLVHGKILRAGFKLNAYLETSLIVMYLKCGSINDSFRIFGWASCKNMISWTVMISGLVQNDCADKALTVYRRMLKLGVMPSTATMACVLAACAQLGSLDLGKSIHGYVLRQRIPLDLLAQNSLVAMYANCGSMEQSRTVFDRMGERDEVSWNAIVNGYAKNGHLCEALFLFNEMRTTLQRPTSITVVSLLQACAPIGSLHQGKWIHNFVIRSCLGPCILIDTALIDMYSKCGDLDTAQKCFDGILEQDLVSWSTIIAGYGRHGKGETALRMYSDFLRTGIEPNYVMFLSVLSACSHNGLVDEGLSIFHSMTEDYGIEPKLEHRACIVDLLSRAGRVEEAYNFYNRFFPDPMATVLGILLDACRTNGNVELGDIIARDILMLKPWSAGNYVQLARSYASMNRWDDVGKAWNQIRSLGLKKNPGWSYIELHGTVETFFMNHNSHPQYEEIVLVLKSLGREMRKMGTNFKTSQIHNILELYSN